MQSTPQTPAPSRLDSSSVSEAHIRVRSSPGFPVTIDDDLATLLDFPGQYPCGRKLDSSCSPLLRTTLIHHRILSQSLQKLPAGVQKSALRAGPANKSPHEVPIPSSSAGLRSNPAQRIPTKDFVKAHVQPTLPAHPQAAGQYLRPFGVIAISVSMRHS